jgi:hypothetical protein
MLYYIIIKNNLLIRKEKEAKEKEAKEAKEDMDQEMKLIHPLQLLTRLPPQSQLPQQFKL